MSNLTKRATLKEIIRAYREGAYVVIVMPLESSNMVGRRNIRRFGTITEAKSAPNNETVYIYNNYIERLQVIQYITSKVKNPKADTKKPEAPDVTKERQIQIEKAIVQAYRDGGQFLLAYHPAVDQNEAVETLRFFGKPSRERIEDGRIQYYVDSIENQIKAVVIVGYPDIL